VADKAVPPARGFDDRTVTLLGQPEVLADLAGVLGSPTRCAVLGALVRSDEPLHIQELARRVQVDASPVRTHLEVLARAGLVKEVTGTSGRERRFTTDLRDARLVLEGIHRPREKAGEPPGKDERRVLKKLEVLGKKQARLEREAERLRGELARARG